MFDGILHRAGLIIEVVDDPADFSSQILLKLPPPASPAASEEMQNAI